MCGTIFSNFSMRNLRIARMVRAELNVVHALLFRHGVVCVSVVLELVAVCQHNKPKTKNQKSIML